MTFCALLCPFVRADVATGNPGLHSKAAQFRQGQFPRRLGAMVVFDGMTTRETGGSLWLIACSDAQHFTFAGGSRPISPKMGI